MSQVKFSKVKTAFKVTRKKAIALQIKKQIHLLHQKPPFLPSLIQEDLGLVLREVLVNSFIHGRCSQTRPAQVEIESDPYQMRIKVRDFGPKYQLPPRLAHRLSTSGRGLWLIKQLVDHLELRCTKGFNELIMVKKLQAPKNLDALSELFEKLHYGIRSMKSTRQIQEIFLDFICFLFNSTRASLMTYDASSNALRVVASVGIPKAIEKKIRVRPGQGVAGHVFETGKALLSSEIEAKNRFNRNGTYRSSSFISVPVVVSPLRIGEETLGVVNLTDKRDGTSFSSKDLKFLNLMATQTAAFLKIRELIDVSTEKKAWEKELDRIRQMQISLLPEGEVSFFSYDVLGFCELSPRGGGDYYDFRIKDKMLFGVLADVSGHQSSTALMMASLRMAFRMAKFPERSLKSSFLQIKKSMQSDLISLGKMVTAWFFRVQGSKVHVIGCGHPPILCVRNSRQVEKIYASGLPLGIESENRVSEYQMTLKAGESLFFFTDGFLDPRIQSMGMEDLVKTIRSKRRTPLKVLSSILIAQYKKSTQHLRAPDDIAGIFLRKK